MARSPKLTTLALVRWLVLVAIPVVWCLLNHYHRLDYFENRTVDWRFRYRGERAAKIKIVYVDVDSRSIEEIGNFPWSRSRYQRVAQALIEHAGVRAVGFDFVLSPAGLPEAADKDRIAESDKQLATYLAGNPPVVFGASYTATEYRAAEGAVAKRELPLVASDPRDISEMDPPELTAFQVGLPVLWSPPVEGLIDTLNGGTRTVALWAPSNTRTFFHAAVELARLYWGLPYGSVKVDGDFLDFVRPDGERVARVPMRDGQLLDVDWFSKWESPYNPRTSFENVDLYAQMLSSDKEEERKAAETFFAQVEFKDAVVLIGPVDSLLQDVATTPFDDKPVPKVGVHGNLLKTIVSGEFLRRPPEWASHVITIGLALLATILGVAGGAGASRSKLIAAAMKVAAVLVVAIYGVVAFGLFDAGNWVLPFVAPLGASFTTGFTALGWAYIDEQRQRGRIKGLFGTYLSPALVERMVESGEDPRLGGHEETITAYFSDIESFSTFSERMSPALLVELMNEYLTACTDIIQEEGGTLDKYIGDAIVAMFGAPVPLADHAFRACLATQRVQQRIAELREKWRREGDKWPTVVHDLRARLGLNTGPAIIGNMGSRSRFSYTMMGDNVNLAARMESGAKSLGVDTMVTESTRAECERHGAGRMIFRYLDRLVVKGRTQPVPVYQIVGLRESVMDQTLECLDFFARGMERYLAQDWDGAEKLFLTSLELEPSRRGQDPKTELNPSRVFLDRCTGMRLHPPGPDWDGVFVMQVK